MTDDETQLNRDAPQVSREVTIVNEQGMHARPVMQFVDLANRFECCIAVTKNEATVDGKSPMEIMLLEAVCGTRLRLSASGTDAEHAIEALGDLIERGFDGF